MTAVFALQAMDEKGTGLLGIGCEGSGTLLSFLVFRFH